MQVRKAVRATLILFPLLGMTYLIWCINPKYMQSEPQQSTINFQFQYMVVNSVLKSSQVKHL